MIFPFVSKSFSDSIWVTGKPIKVEMKHKKDSVKISV